ncbi:MAG: GTP pyrophosphokinase (EC, (p)ppGpp synthetase II / Guanosine-3',5'-bis(diphosphate) 3'-pyrophosphohydrolase (EC [uncultured Sulfurovum sp.]|uniref:GTP pyrophosphokinase (EC, (P)ppGpp synthetase II / Guanosine-3',5'-bis(Diphosphate) 3'-pyrophosphohydrolase (EC)) n=1 Tax=uncultured Sulfurovum sp. TaxID=269237 RepID=A0A6S6RSV1_9BACT|nr:MAG: GTP pyrophosphokinase (EC, (p)ppGpp synthetase II / Guanosine-3',5'-bis(diphosphate) 3'-pyrophosphohydrolase (EC [uncultured Sulfurovum sp.]
MLEALLDKALNVSTIEEAEELLREYHPNPTALFHTALNLAKVAHAPQKRKSGEPYIIHPILVATITALVSNDESMVIAALLHDVVEDTEYVIEEIEEIFGEDVAHMVEGLTKIEDIREVELVPSSSEQKLISSAMTFRKMLLSSIKDVRVLVVKLCDRLHNMTTLDALAPEKQLRIAEETMVVYAPIAHRLGISQLKNRLEDLSFSYIYPEAYQHIEEYIEKNSQNLHLKLNTFVREIQKLAKENGFAEGEIEVFGRVKHYYSMYQKMQRKGIGIDEILDLIAIRILVKQDIDCYKILGALHLNYKPIISRFKDYITLPKENGYSTIHTTLFNDSGIVEAQIRTFEMHKTAEFGVAAHWRYKDGRQQKQKVNLQWLESLQYQNDSVEEFYSLAKGDLFVDDISVFSPDGDNYTLPRESVVLDFAYTIHSDIGDKAISALVNKRKKSLLTTLKNGDIIRINTDENAKVHCSWYDTVKTSKAKEGIRSACNHKLKACDKLAAINILTELAYECKEINTEKVESMFELCKLKENAYKMTSNKDIYEEVSAKFLEKLASSDISCNKPEELIKEHFRIITNKEIVKIEFDYCCHPKMGDEIVGFVEDNEVVIHHKLCQQAYRKMKAKDAMVFVTWADEKSSRYQLIISLQNRQGILADLLAKLAKLDLNVLNIELGIKSSDSAEFCKLEVETKEQNVKKLEEKLNQKFKLIEMISLNDAYSKK